MQTRATPVSQDMLEIKHALVQTCDVVATALHTAVTS